MNATTNKSAGTRPARAASSKASSTRTAKAKPSVDAIPEPHEGVHCDIGDRRTILVMQGGGALGAYQAGVYQALHEAGIEPDWVIGTSIGAINGSIIAGNTPENRMARLDEFWSRMEKRQASPWSWTLGGLDALLGDDGFSSLPNFYRSAATGALNAFKQWGRANDVVMNGIPAFFRPNAPAWVSPQIPLGIEQAAYYDTSPLRDTLIDLVDFEYLVSAKDQTRLTVGAVNARSGNMRYFDSHQDLLQPEHVMASGALAPGFPAVRIDGDPYWDGGLYSNTPIEAVLEDKPRRNSLIFSAQLWHPRGPEPESVWEIESRLKDIQFASRVLSHVEREKQMHRLRHVIYQMTTHMPESLRNSKAIKDLELCGCDKLMHIIRLNAPMLPGEDSTKDIDFSPKGIKARRQAGYRDTAAVLQEKPWEQTSDDVLDALRVYERGWGPSDDQ